MAIAKQFLKSKPLAKVTFELTAEAVNGAKTVALAVNLMTGTLLPRS